MATSFETAYFGKHVMITKSGQESSRELRPILLYVLFFLSGFPALLYQVVWQRSLFAIYGVNIESVTVVVSAFMLGLGLGSLAGGLVSERQGMPLLVIFGIAELGIAAFGVFSLRIFHEVALFTAGASALKTGIVTFFLLLIPTVLMGGTLPILVAYLVRISGNVGRSVGALYFVNTLGSAAACFCATYITMYYLGQSGTVSLAACINSAVGVSILTLYFYARNKPVVEQQGRGSSGDDANLPANEEAQLFPLAMAVLVSSLAGFVALGYEIMWYRVYAFTSGGMAQAFALLLGFYLSGIAFGSLLARIFCHQMNQKSLGRHLQTLAGFILVANLSAYLLIPVVSQFGRFYGFFRSLPFVTLATILLGATFPWISHVAVKPNRTAGAHLSFLYLGNIIGSTLGSFVVGYILMDILTLKTIAVAIAMAGIGLAAVILLSSKVTDRSRTLTVALGAGLVVALILSAGPLYDSTYERLQEKKAYIPGYTYKHLVETKSGVVTVQADGQVFGGGVYDGRFSTSIEHDINGIFRPYSLSLWHPAPRNVLMVGLASGSWAQVVANHPRVEKLTVVEINPGYLKLIPLYPAVSSVLHNPKVEIVIDDGRRWLVRNPEASFDAIVMNTTFYWRAHVTNLLSTDFLQLARRHLKPGGVLFYNTTSSGEVQITGATIFPYAFMIGNCIAVSDSPITLDWDRWKQILLEYRIDGIPTFNLEKPEDAKRLQELMSARTNDRHNAESVEYSESIRSRNKGKRIITDDNMGTEWPKVRLPW